MKRVNDAVVIVGQGPRHVEGVLLDEIAARRPRSVDELATPLRVIVPSEALRRHLCRRLVQRFGALVGVEVQTLLGVSRDVVGRAGGAVACHDAAFELVARRLARAHPMLRHGFDELDDGYAAVAGTVRDLLDAGLETEHAEALQDTIAQLAEGVAPGERLRRAQAVVEVAAWVRAWAAEAALVNATVLQREAQRLVEARGVEALPACSVLVHGFADFTAVAGDLVQAIVGACGGAILFDRPKDPADPQRPDPGNAFLDRAAVRFGGLPWQQRACPAELTGVLRVVEADDAEQQAAALALEISALLEGGVVAENIGVVARDCAPFIGPLWRQLDRMGVPFSTLGVRFDGAGPGRRARAFFELLGNGGASSVELWRCARGEGHAAMALALATLGLKRLEDVVRLSPAELAGRDLELPVAAAPADPRRDGKGLRVSAAALAAEGERAQLLLDLVAEWPQSAAVQEHLARTLQALELIAWVEVDEDLEGLWESLEELARELAPLPTVDREGWLRIAQERVGETLRRSAGGAGAGVQVLTVMEARAVTFDHLFILGVERGLFPRQVVEDPLLPDGVRGRLLDVLPQLPVKARGWSEDSYLFAQLAAAASATWVCWGRRRDGAASAPSPFVDRLRFAGVVGEGARLPDGSCGAFLGALEHALTMSDVAGLAPFLGAAFDEGRTRARCGSTRVSGEQLAVARCELLELLDGSQSSRSPSPFWGLLGGEKQLASISVSRLEAIARCPWQAFVTRELRVDRQADPSLEFAGFDARLRGDVVHRVLQEIAAAPFDEPPRSLARATTSAGARPVRWPEDGRLAALIDEALTTVFRRYRLAPTATMPLLAAAVRPYLEVAGQLEWQGEDPLPVLGAELQGSADLAGVTVGFRVDRVDEGDEAPIFVDYKTGRPPDTGAKPETRLRKLRRAVREGVNLQLTAYLSSSSAPRSVARYAFLAPQVASDDLSVRRLQLSADDDEAARAFEAAVRELVAALVAGAWIPRMDAPGNRKAELQCARRCRVREACIRDDSDQRRRLFEWLTALPADGGELPLAVAQAVADLWRMGES